MVEAEHPELSVRRQCEWLELNRATYYYVAARESPLNLELMRLIDEQDLQTLDYGWPRMTVWLRAQGCLVNHKRVQRLMRKMGIQSLLPKPNLSQPNREHKIYPYLLRGMEITHANQVWSTEITYVPMRQGFMYLVAVIDWFSRYILTWQLSNTLESSFCVDALQQALRMGKPEIFNTDQGSQFTATVFTDVLNSAKVRISMDGKGRALDNVFIERFWRNLKYEDIYLKRYETVQSLYLGLDDYFTRYNHNRPHQRLGYQTPATVDHQALGRATTTTTKTHAHCRFAVPIRARCFVGFPDFR